MVFENDLIKLGLSDKESAVYLSCLQLGSAPVQQIARKAKVVRATTYVILESLMEMGLVTRFREGKKTLFTPEPPRQLMRLLEKQREVIDEKQQELEGILPELQVLMRGSEGRPTVRYFEGIEGVRAMRTEMVMYTRAGDVWYNFTPVDHLKAIFGSSEEVFYTKQRVAKGIKGKTIFSTRSESLHKAQLVNVPSDITERRYVAPENFPSTSGMTIYRDRIAIGNFTGKIGGVIIESQAMADMMRSLFELAWVGLDSN